MALKIRTNYHYYPLLYYYELSPKYQAIAKRDYDWDDGLEENAQLFIYRGQLYHLEDFMRFDYPAGSGKPEEFADWEAYSNDSFFSGIVIRYAKDEYGYQTYDALQVATFYS